MLSDFQSHNHESSIAANYNGNLGTLASAGGQ